MMPQFDTFSFFSQLFWVFLGFTYLYLMLSFYLLPAFAATLKIRAKKLAQVSGGLGTTDVVSSPFSGSLFFENLTSKLSSISFQRESSDTTSPFNHLVLKNEAFYKFNLSLLSEFKIVTLFISSKKK